MTPTETEAERRALVKAIVRRLQDHAPGTEPLGADAEPFATELAAMAMQLGWRPVLARAADWRQQVTGPKGSLDPEVMEALRSGDYAKAYEATHQTTVPGQGTAPATETSTNGGN